MLVAIVAIFGIWLVIQYQRAGADCLPLMLLVVAFLAMVALSGAGLAFR